MASKRPSPFTESGELTSVGRMLAARTLVLAAIMAVIGISVGNVWLAVVLPLAAIALPAGAMLYLRRRSLR